MSKNKNWLNDALNVIRVFIIVSLLVIIAVLFILKWEKSDTQTKGAKPTETSVPEPTIGYSTVIPTETPVITPTIEPTSTEPSIKASPSPRPSPTKKPSTKPSPKPTPKLSTKPSPSPKPTTKPSPSPSPTSKYYIPS